MSTNYTTLIASAKVAARDFLRTQKIMPHLAKITTLKTEIADTTQFFNETMARKEKNVAVKEFESAAMADAHPLKAERVEEATKARAEFEEYKKKATEDFNKEIESLNKKIEEHQLAVTEWTEGKRLVSKDDLQVLTQNYVAARIKDSFVSGEYDAPATA